VEGKLKEDKKKKYCVRLWYTWYDDIEVEAESAEEAENIIRGMDEDKIFEDFDISDLEYDTTEIFGGEE
jgi:hypothetical protein